MLKKIYVGNLPFDTEEDEVRELLEKFGGVESVKMILDRETNRFRGFVFVEMDQAGADLAIGELDGKEFGGRALRVNDAVEREKTPQRELSDNDLRRRVRDNRPSEGPPPVGPPGGIPGSHLYKGDQKPDNFGNREDYGRGNAQSRSRQFDGRRRSGW